MGMKFIRGMVYPNATSGGRGVSWRIKWIYEFWGFCINGTSSLTVPGGMAANNPVNMTADFTTNSLMASGSDGYHPSISGELFSGDCLFTAQSSTPFTASMVGKALVMWKPGSDSSEDSIYVITQVINSSQIIININTGGIPSPTTKHPSMTLRTGVNYRVVDMELGAASPLNGGFIVLQTDASSINPGQGNSQIQLGCSSIGSSNSNINFQLGISGTGSWNGSQLSISAASNTSPIVITTTTPHNLTTGQAVSISGVTGNTNANGNWVITSTGTNSFSLVGSTSNGTGTSGTVTNSFVNDGYTGVTSFTTEAGGSYTAGQTAITMIGDKTFLICHIKEQSIFQDNYGLTIHFEIPQRLYPQQADLHPVAILVQTMAGGGIGNGMTTNSTTQSYGGGFLMRTHSADPTTIRKHRILVKALRGDGLPDVFGQNLNDYRIGYNTVAGTVPISDSLLCLPGIQGQYSLARVRLRTVKFTGTQVPKHHRLGQNGEFIQLQNGICWPWDNTIQVLQLLPFGAI